MEHVVDQRADCGIRYMFSTAQRLFPGERVRLCHQRNKGWDKRVAVLRRKVSVSRWKQRPHKQEDLPPVGHTTTIGIDDDMLRHNKQLCKAYKASCYWMKNATILLDPSDSGMIRITSASTGKGNIHDHRKTRPQQSDRSRIKAAGSTHGLFAWSMVVVVVCARSAVPRYSIATHLIQLQPTVSFPSPGALHGRVDSVRRRTAL